MAACAEVASDLFNRAEYRGEFEAPAEALEGVVVAAEDRHAVELVMVAVF